MNDNMKIIPPFKGWVLENFPFIEADFDAITNYQLIGKIVEYLNNIINNENEQNEAIEDLYNKLNELLTHFDTTIDEKIDNKIEQLNLQEEINNKLDQMVLDGVFDDILTRVIPENIIQSFDTLEDLINSNLEVGTTAKILGYYSKYDGGDGLYKIISGSADNKFSYEISNGNIAELINKNNFNVLQIGAKRNDPTFDNATVFQFIFKSGLNDTKIYVPDGTYYTSRINYLGDNTETNNFSLIGIGNPIIKLIHSNAVKTTVETYNESYYVSKYIDTISTGNKFTLSTIKLANNKIYYYLSVNDNTILPDSLVAGLVIEGINSKCKAVISNIDKDNPDGEGTARIYLYETYNDVNRNNVFSNTSNTINENFGIKENLSDLYLYIRFNDNNVPSSLTVNRQIEQIENGHKARVNKNNIVYEGINFVKVDCMPEEKIFTSNNLYLEDNTPFNINTYTGYTAGMLSLNRYTNSIIDGITFDGGNLDVSKYEDNYNSWNTIITGGCKNIKIINCKFNNSIMAGLQIGGIGNSNSSAKHDYPEHVIVENCNFYNNGRGDIEVIYGKNITIENCVGSGVLDIEANGTEILDNININNCNFYSITPYAPSAINSLCFININNSRFFKFVVQGIISVNLSNVNINSLEPQIANVKALNCSFNLFTGLNGNECLDFTNCDIYGLYKTTPGSQYGQTKLLFNNCVIDLSLSPINSNKLYNIEEVKLANSILISSTKRNVITDNLSVYKFYNSKIKNVHIRGVSVYGGSQPKNSIFDSCEFLATDKTQVTTEQCLGGTIIGGIIKNCYIETRIGIEYSHYDFINCILNSTTKPFIYCFDNVYLSGIKSDNDQGISWNWTKTGTAGSLVRFDDIQFAPTISSTLGVTNGVTAVTTSSVADGCRGYYVGSTDKALVRIYHNDGALALKEISFT